MPHILILEPNPDIRTELKELLLYEGFESACAENGAVAWEMLQDKTPDLILSCIQMPDINGLEWLTRLRQNPNHRLIPFIFLSGLATQEHIRQAMNLGADDYLLKPVSSYDLLTAIRTRLKRRKEIEALLYLERSQFRNQLLHNLSHEFLTPLNVLLGTSQVLKNKLNRLPPEEVRKLVELLQRNASRLNHLLQNQLLYLELENQLSSLQLTAFQRSCPPINLAYQVKITAQERARYHQREYDLQLELKDGQVQILEKHFQVIVREVCDNAFKFSKPGQPVIISSRERKNTWHFKVLNVGSGMTAEQLSKIRAYTQFERKEQEQQGIGMGLALARYLLNLYQSDLDIQSQHERYTQITFNLPCP